MKSWMFHRGFSCRQVMEVLQSYLDGEVDAATARRVMVHLDTCTPCDHESDVYERIKISLSRRRPEIDQKVAAALDDFIRHMLRDEPPVEGG